MQYVVDTYILEYLEETKQYYISFKDIVGHECRIEINRDIFDAYIESKKAYKKIENEFDRHIEHSEIYINSLHKRAINKSETLEEIVENKIINSELKKAIKELPEAQKRRLEKYYFEDKTFEQIAQEEKCTKRAIKFSVDIAIKKISKINKN